MALVSDNPWHRLPDRPPYVLPDEEAVLRQFNDNVAPDYRLHIDEIAPEAFIGARDAPVVLLSNNPGFEKVGPERRKPVFALKVRRNLLHEPSDYPFLFLAPDFSGADRQWWESKLKDLIEEFGVQRVAQSILNVVYFPYPSGKFGHWSLRLPSQNYSFHLVREAVDRNAAIVLMRKGKRMVDLWKCAVPELNGYARLYEVRNSRNPAISRRNCDYFEDIANAIRGT
jgi:hypothetical protein